MILTVTSTGCHNSNVQSLSKGEWIRRIIDRAGIQGYTEEKPYFMNIPAQSEYFSDVQAAVEWEIIDPSYPFDPEETLNNEWTAFTLVNLSADLPEGNASSIKDISKSMFSDQVASAVASGLMTLDSRRMFHPKDAIDKETAFACLDKVIEYINNRHFENTEMSVEWKDGVEVYESVPLAVDEETGTAYVSDDCEAEEGDILAWRDGLDYYAYQVTSREGNEAELEEYDLSEAVESMEAKGSVEINFNEIEIYDGNGVLIQGIETGSTENDFIHRMAKRTVSHHFEINGFAIDTKSSDSNFSIEASKKVNNGKIYASLSLSGMSADYNLGHLLQGYRDSYFHMSFTTSETLGIKTDFSKDLVADFSRIDKDNFLSSLSGVMRAKDDAVETELKIATMRIPLGSLPMCDMLVDVKLQLKTTGKAEIVLTQKNNLGYEYKNGSFRVIRENEHTTDLSLKAETSLTANVTAGIVTVGVKLMDAGVRAGAKASMNVKVHIYDDEGQLASYDVDASGDVADEMASQVDDVLVCADLSGNWILDIVFFSKDTAAAKLFGTQTISILDASNAPLFKGGKQHFENWQMVSECTRKARPKTEEREAMETRGTIHLDQYSLAVHIGTAKSISVVGLPEGYAMSDLIVTSSDPSVASVNGLTVTGVASGSAVITVATKDGSFHTSCNVLVPQEKRS